MTATAPLKLPKTLVLVGMMGAGKTAIGRRLAARLDIPFVDADDEIEAAAGCSIEDIFEQYGEAEFRGGEHRVIDRLLNDPVHILATGGGAFINAATRLELKRRGISLWLRADLDVLWHRVRRRSNRPMLKTPDPRGTLAKLIETRYPLYAEADITVDSIDAPPEDIVEGVLDAIESFLRTQGDEA
jgi:shikimate kinase